MSTPSCARTVAPLDQMVTAPPPAVTSGRLSKTVTSCPSRNRPRAMEIPPTPAPTTKTRNGLISYLQPLLRCTRRIRSLLKNSCGVIGFIGSVWCSPCRPGRGTAIALKGCLRIGASHCMQCEPQRMHGIVQPRPHRPFGDLQIGGDLRSRPAVVIRPPDHGTVIRGKRSERTAQQHSVQGGVHLIGACVVEDHLRVRDH